jgi:hypothetical protein
LRRLKPQRRAGNLARSPDAALPFVTGRLAAGPELLLDALLQIRPLNHLSLCLAELLHAFGRLDLDHPGTSSTLRELRRTVENIPPHRLEDPSTGVVAEAGMLAGLLFRLTGAPKGREIAMLNDAILFLHAIERGYTVLTRNVRDFDLLGQLVRSDRVLFYRTT